MRSGLVSLFTAESTITDIVGTSGVYVEKARQTASLPYVIISQIDSEEFVTLDGTGALRNMSFNLDCMSQTSLQAESLGNAVRAFIQDYSGTAGTFTIDSVVFNGEQTDYFPPEDASDVGIYMVTLNIDVFFQQP